MSFGQNIKTLPAPLLVLLAVFVMLPIGSLFFVDSPAVVLMRDGFPKAVLLLSAYWVIPAAISSFTLLRSFAFIPLFFIECGLLLLHSILDVNSLPADVQTLRYFLLGGMTLFTIVFLNRDMLYPLLAGNRLWRSKPRLYVQVPMHVWFHDDPSSKLPVVVHNCSHNGLGLSGPADRLRALLDRKDQINHFLIHVGHAGKNWMLNVTLIRTKQEEAVLYAGLRVHNTEVMTNFIGQVETLMPPQNTLGHSFSRYWVRSGFRHAMIVLWAMSMLGVMVMPACGHPPETREAPAIAVPTSHQRSLPETRPFLSKANSPPY